MHINNPVDRSEAAIMCLLEAVANSVLVGNDVSANKTQVSLGYRIKTYRPDLIVMLYAGQVWHSN